MMMTTTALRRSPEPTECVRYIIIIYTGRASYTLTIIFRLKILITNGIIEL